MDDSLPFHLLLPLLASLLFVFGLMFVKKARGYGVNIWTVTLTANVLVLVMFFGYLLIASLLSASPLSKPFFGEGGVQPSMYWQPVLISCLFVMGQLFTFSAISYGDVSVATPIFSIKILLVAFLVTLVAGEVLAAVVWIAAALAMLGIGLVQFSGQIQPARIGFTVLFALLAVSCYAMNDVLVQRFAPAWTAGRFMPMVFVISAGLSLALLPAVNNPFRLESKARTMLLLGASCMAGQAICLICVISIFGDAARVNIVFALRGLWGVLLAFWFAHRFGSAEADASRGTLILRLVGATLLTVAVVIAIAGRDWL